MSTTFCLSGGSITAHHLGYDGQDSQMMEVVVVQYVIGAVVGFVMAIALTWIGAAAPSIVQPAQAQGGWSTAYSKCAMRYIGDAHVSESVAMVLKACQSLSR